MLELREIPGIGTMKDVSFFELGLGSFDVANLSAELEAIYPRFVVGDIFKHPTIRALAAYLDEAFGARAPGSLEESAPAPEPAETCVASAAADTEIDFSLFRT